MIDARVLPAAPIADFVHSILRETPNNGFTTLVVCSTREKFLEQLTASVATNLQEHELSEEDNEQPESPLDLLTNTIGAIAKSKRVKLVFCSSLAQLRAYLATFRLLPLVRQDENSSNTLDGRKQEAGCECGITTTIAILNLVAMHYLSTEFSAQGLSRTLALAVETAARTGSAIVLCECSDAVNVGNPDHGQRLWELHVPVLNGGTVRAENAQTPSTRHVSVRRVAQKWFRFEEGK